MVESSLLVQELRLDGGFQLQEQQPLNKLQWPTEKGDRPVIICIISYLTWF